MGITWEIRGMRWALLHLGFYSEPFSLLILLEYELNDLLAQEAYSAI